MHRTGRWKSWYKQNVFCFAEKGAPLAKIFILRVSIYGKIGLDWSYRVGCKFYRLRIWRSPRNRDGVRMNGQVFLSRRGRGCSERTNIPNGVSLKFRTRTRTFASRTTHFSMFSLYFHCIQCFSFNFRNSEWYKSSKRKRNQNPA